MRIVSILFFVVGLLGFVLSLAGGRGMGDVVAGISFQLLMVIGALLRVGNYLQAAAKTKAAEA